MRRLGRWIWLIITILLVAITIVFATSNEALITLHLWPLEGVLTAPIWLVVMSSFITGGLLSVILMWGQALAIRARLWNLQGKFNRLEAATAQQQSAKQEHGDEQVNGVPAANYSPTPNTKNQDPQTLLSEPLRTDHTLR